MKEIKTSWKQFQSDIKKWQNLTPKTAAIILNKTSFEADIKSRKNIKKSMIFRSARTQVYTIGRPSGKGYSNAGVYRYPSRLNKQRLSDVRVVMGVKKRHPFLDIHNHGGIIKPKDQKYHYTAQARGGSYRKLPGTLGRLKKGQRLPELGKNLSKKAHFAAMQKMRRTKQPFVARSRKIGGRKRRAGVYIFQGNRMIMLRGFQLQPIKIKASKWHDNAILSVTKGQLMRKIILREMDNLYKRNK